MPSDKEVERISQLFSDLTQLGFEQEPELGCRTDWRPVSRQGKQLFGELTSLDNRESLRKWYARYRNLELNPTAANIKASLELAISEHLE